MFVFVGTIVGTTPVLAESPHGGQRKLNYKEGDHFDRDLLRYGDVREIDRARQRVEVEDRVYTIIKDTREIIDILDQ